MKIKNLSIYFLLLPFFAVAQNYADCDRAMDICKKQVYHVEKVQGEGANNREADFISCFMNGENHGQAEQNSTWIKFEIAKSGSLTFAITPHKFDNDMDFVVYKMPADGDCRYKQIIRCMAAGDPENEALTSKCMGETGLRDGERASSRDAGCNDEGDNTWLAPLRVVEGEKYVILVSNVTQAGPGFSIRFGGTCKLPCDEEPKKEPAITKKTKPKPKPETIPEPIKVKTLTSEKPEKIGGRPVEVGKTIKISNRKIKVKVWDSQVQDGDICSVYLNEVKVVDRIYLTLKPKEFELELPSGRSDYYLTIHAEDFGKAEINTCRVVVFDGNTEQTVDLVAAQGKEECLKIIIE